MIDGDDHGTIVTLKTIIRTFIRCIVAGDAVDVPDDDAPDHVPVHPASGLGPVYWFPKMADPRDSPYNSLDLP